MLTPITSLLVSPRLQDEPKTVDLDPGLLWAKLDAWLDGAVRLLPNMVVALVLLVATWLVAKGVRGLILSQAEKHQRLDLGAMLGGFARATIVVVGSLLAMTVVAPSLKPGDLIAGLGVSSVAIGFAFKDILQNWLAGLLILLRQPFEVGDQIEVDGYEGTVDSIQTRSTLIRTYDGQRAVIPNSEIYTKAVLVKTAYELRRSQYDIGIGYADDVHEARQALLEAVQKIDGVEADPGPQVIPWDLAASWVTLRVRWWTNSRKADRVKIHGDVITAIKQTLDDAKIDMPYETRVHLFHDQTEEGDGDRAQQREGWPSEDSKGTRPRWQAQAEQDAQRQPQGAGTAE